MSHIAEVRAILSEGESAETWEALAEYLTPLKDNKKDKAVLVDELIPYCQAHLGEWPVGLRRYALEEWCYRDGRKRRPVKQWHPAMILANAVLWEGFGLQNKDIVTIVKSPLLANIQYLELQRNEIGRGGLTAIVESPYLTSVRELNLAYNYYSSGVLKDLPYLAKWPHFEKFILFEPHYDAWIHVEEIQALAKAGGWTAILDSSEFE